MSRSETLKQKEMENKKMTVKELIEALQEMVEQGHGDCEVVSDHNDVEEVFYNKRLDRVEV
jgi:ribonuclease HI